MTYKPPVVRPSESDWPRELAHMRWRLIVRGFLHAMTPLVIVLILVVGVFTLEAVYLGNQIRKLSEAYFTPDQARVVRLTFTSLVTLFSLAPAVAWFERRRTKYYQRVLLSHGFCYCGYKYIEQDGARSCPECGRQWMVKQPPRE